MFDSIEKYVQSSGLILGIATLGIIVAGFIRSKGAPAGRTEGRGTKVLDWRILSLFTIIFIVVMAQLWRPLPISLPIEWRWALLIIGSVIYLSSIALYLWGFFTLGRMFSASTSFGIRLFHEHQLIQQGPYAFVRHPMYLAVISTGLGMILLFKTYAAMIFFVMMFSLVRRARKEEQVLAKEFGEQWMDYCRRVPGWIPIFKL
jgi:protein-S-isoprenylcysteine O-methyltransferase Ste14